MVWIWGWLKSGLSTGDATFFWGIVLVLGVVMGLEMAVDGGDCLGKWRMEGVWREQSTLFLGFITLGGLLINDLWQPILALVVPVIAAETIFCNFMNEISSKNMVI